MESTPPVVARLPDPRRINSAAEHAKTKATLECFMETTNEGMNELGRQTQLTYNVASHHIGLLEGQVSSLHQGMQSVESRSDGNEGRMVVVEGRVTTCENVMRGLSMQLTGLERAYASGEMRAQCSGGRSASFIGSEYRIDGSHTPVGVQPAACVSLRRFKRAAGMLG